MRDARDGAPGDFLHELEIVAEHLDLDRRVQREGRRARHVERLHGRVIADHAPHARQQALLVLDRRRVGLEPDRQARGVLALDVARQGVGLDADGQGRELDALDRASEGAAFIDNTTLGHALDGLYANDSAEPSQAVQIMTMHKAKGLEFDHVILPGLHRASRGSERPALVQSSVLLDEHEAPLLAPIPHRESDDDPLYRLLHQQIEGARDRAEAERLLYVATTRAIRQLHCFADVQRKEDGNVKVGNGLLSHLWPAVGEAVIRQLDATDTEPSESTTAAEPLQENPTMLHRLPADWSAPPPPDGLPPAPAPSISPESIPPFDWAGERARVTGTLYHLCVEGIANEGLAHWDAARLEGQRAWLNARARASGLDTAEADATVEQVLAAVQITLSDPDGQWLLQAHAGGHACELAMDTMADGVFRRLRIDRTFVDDAGVRWIVDYKTGTHEGGDLEGFIANETERYRGQLQRYAALFADEGRPVRLALYLPLLPPGRRLIRVSGDDPRETRNAEESTESR